MVKNDIKIMKKHCDKLKLGDKPTITFQDQVRLSESLKAEGEYELSQYVQDLGGPAELEDLLVNTIYG